MNGDEWVALLGLSSSDPALADVLSALGQAGALSLDDDGDGEADLVDSHGVQLDFGGGQCVAIQFIRDGFTAALPHGLSWDVAEVRLPEHENSVENGSGVVTYAVGDALLDVCLEESAVYAVVARGK